MIVSWCYLLLKLYSQDDNVIYLLVLNPSLRGIYAPGILPGFHSHCLLLMWNTSQCKITENRSLLSHSNSFGHRQPSHPHQSLLFHSLLYIIAERGTEGIFYSFHIYASYLPVLWLETDASRFSRQPSKGSPSLEIIEPTFKLCIYVQVLQPIRVLYIITNMSFYYC